MNPLKRRVTVVLFGVVMAAAACGGGSSSSTSTTAKPSRGFTGTTAGQQAQVPFLNTSGQALSCSGATTGAPTGGFVVIKQNADNTVSADVELKNAVPDATYFANIWLTNGSAQCFLEIGGEVKTNGQGVGSAHISVKTRSGTTGAYVSAFTTSGAAPGRTRDPQATGNYVFGSK
jgi:hypothetical protein